MRTLLILLLLACTAFSSSQVTHDPEKKIITITTTDGDLQLCLDYNKQCSIEQVFVKKKNVLAENVGVYTGLKIQDQYATSLELIQDPTVSINEDQVVLDGIEYKQTNVGIIEQWTFIPKGNHITWRIRQINRGSGVVNEKLFPVWNFAAMDTWEGALLDNGGVAWCRFLDKPHTTYGCETQTVAFWNTKEDSCLKISPTLSPNANMSVRFTRQPNGIFTFVSNIATERCKPKYDLCRFLPDRQDVWAPITVQPSILTAEFDLSVTSYSQTYNRGTFHGLDGKTVGEILNTIARYGVVDKNLTGSNGWRTGFTCLHEPWFAQMALAIDDQDYTNNLQRSLDYARDVAIEPSGRVKSRFSYNKDDAIPGTFDKNGFYEAQWGILLDSQADYVINVAELLDLTGNFDWVRGQKETCEKVLGYMLQRDSDGNGLVEVIPNSLKEQKSSDWIDIVWASYENAYINAGLYDALVLWADVEKELGDFAKAKEYADFAQRLKTTFNKNTKDGGFWDPEKKWYVYWREKDGSVHGDNLVTPVNFMAIAYGLCDDPSRSGEILDQIETLMQKENLFYWPLCFFPYKREEVHDNNWPFPRYENGDIFLAFGETAARAYATHSPGTALKYIKNVLNKYKQDGLAHQRYTRKEQQGVGEDILANNSLPVVGLYRNLFGIRPKANRLYIEPHLTPELEGSVVNYTFRGQKYSITLYKNKYSVSSDSFTLNTSEPFGVSIWDTGCSFYAGKETALSTAPSMIISKTEPQPTGISIASWSASSKKWNIQSNGILPKLEYTISQLNPKTKYQLLINGKVQKSYDSDERGLITFSSADVAEKECNYELTLSAE